MISSKYIFLFYRQLYKKGRTFLEIYKSYSFQVIQNKRKLLDFFKTQVEKIQDMKSLFYIIGKMLVELKIIIQDIAKDVYNAKDILQKEKLIIAYLESLHFLNCLILL